MLNIICANNNTATRRLRSAVTGCLAAALLTAAAPFAALAQDSSPQAVIYNNAPFITGAVSKNGTAAPAGKQFSEVQNNLNNTTESNTLAASSATGIGTTTNFRLADDFVVPVGETWTINNVIIYSLAVGATSNPVNNINLRIWNGRPGDAGSTIIFGDTTTNRFVSGVDTNVLRIFNSAVPASNTPRTDLSIYAETAAVSPALVLTAGNYWIDYQTVTAATGVFSPLATIVNTRTVPFYNARQFTTAGWVDVFDDGNPASAPNASLDLPFQIDGTRTGQRAITPSRSLDFNGDNRTDYAVVRPSGSQLTWFIQNNGVATQQNLPFGTTGDVPVPADYDGDGKADIAVFRGSATQDQSFFYIINSTTGTFRAERFGAAGDDATVVGDYDGDGKADVAVYRAGAAAGAQSFFYFRPSATSGANFRGVPFGQNGDKPYPGDFDGDGRFDFAVVRNSGGNAVHYQSLSTAGFRTTFFGNFTDRFVTADFDGDNRTDLTAVRNNGTAVQWFVNRSASNQFFEIDFGTNLDVLAPGDYDGDNKTDLAVFRNGVFFQLNTSVAPLATQWGQTGDIAPAAYQVH